MFGITMSVDIALFYHIPSGCHAVSYYQVNRNPVLGAHLGFEIDACYIYVYKH